MGTISARLLAFIACLCLAVSCGSGYKRDDPIYARDTGELAGTILEVGTKHTFENGLSGPSVRYRRASDGAEVWASMDAFEAAYEVRRGK
jgi:hypothetical protein